MGRQTPCMGITGSRWCPDSPHFHTTTKGPRDAHQKHTTTSSNLCITWCGATVRLEDCVFWHGRPSDEWLAVIHLTRQLYSTDRRLCYYVLGPNTDRTGDDAWSTEAHEGDVCYVVFRYVVCYVHNSICWNVCSEILLLRPALHWVSVEPRFTAHFSSPSGTVSDVFFAWKHLHIRIIIFTISNAAYHNIMNIS